MNVYLCGPMEGLSAQLAGEWRQTAATQLAVAGISTLDPMRRRRFHDQPYSMNLARKIEALDLQDIMASRVVLANLVDIGNGRGWGTICEIALTSQLYHLPIVTYVTKEFRHPFIDTFTTEACYTLNEAIEACKGYFN